MAFHLNTSVQGKLVNYHIAGAQELALRMG